MRIVKVASYDNYMLIYSYLTFCFLLFAFLLFSMTTLLQLGVNIFLSLIVYHEVSMTTLIVAEIYVKILALIVDFLLS